jgi:hypothetical protein
LGDGIIDEIFALSLSKHAKLFGNSWAHAEYISDDDDFE